MNKFKQYMVIDCYAFTVVVLFNALLQRLGIAEEAPMSYCLYMFIASSIIALLMFITDLIIGEREKLKKIFHVLDVVIPVLLMTMLQNKFRLGFKEIIITGIFSLIAYGIVCLMMYLSWRESDIKLNENIQRMRNRK